MKAKYPNRLDYEGKEDLNIKHVKNPQRIRNSVKRQRATDEEKKKRLRKKRKKFLQLQKTNEKSDYLKEMLWRKEKSISETRQLYKEDFKEMILEIHRLRNIRLFKAEKDVKQNIERRIRMCWNAIDQTW